MAEQSSTSAGSSEPKNPGTVSSFASAFSGLKDKSLYEAAKDVPELPESEKTTGPVQQAAIPSKNSMLVNNRQRGNPLLQYIRQVPYEYAEIVPDYVMGATTCAIFLSLRYHKLNPKYIHERVKLLGKQYKLRVLILQMDTKESHSELQTLNRLCILVNLTLMLCWSAEEAASLIETYKVFEHKPPDLIMEKPQQNSTLQIIEALCSIHSVNRTDAMTLLSKFGSLSGIIGASAAELSTCPGVGPLKAEKLHKTLHLSFKK